MKPALLAMALILAIVAAPMAAAEDPEEPPEGCTTKVPFTPIIVTLGARKITVVPETWICPPPL